MPEILAAESCPVGQRTPDVEVNERSQQIKERSEVIEKYCHPENRVPLRGKMMGQQEAGDYQQGGRKPRRTGLQSPVEIEDQQRKENNQ